MNKNDLLLGVNIQNQHIAIGNAVTTHVTSHVTARENTLWCRVTDRARSSMAVLLTMRLGTTLEIPALDSSGKTMTLTNSRKHNANTRLNVAHLVLISDLNWRNAILAAVFKNLRHLHLRTGNFFRSHSDS